MMPGEIASESIYYPIPNFIRLEQLAYCQTGFIKSLQFSHMAANFHFALFALSNVFFDANKMRDFSTFIEDWRNRYIFPIQLIVLFLIQKFSVPYPARCNRLPQVCIVCI